MYVGLKQPRGDRERYVTPARAAAKETRPGGAKVQVTGHRSHVTGYRLQVTGYRLQVTIKNTCEFAVSSYFVRIIYFVFFSLHSLFIPTNPMMSSYFFNFLV